MGRGPGKRAVLIAGPTASGKSALALERARAIGGVVINTDAMQVYDVLSVLTARPGLEEMADVPHRLYGTVPAGTRFSTGDWLRAVAALIAELDGQPLIFVGGTGLYFEALTDGFAEVPEVSPEMTLKVQQEIQLLDAGERLDLLKREDPEAAARIRVADPQRLIRALAVKRATGRTLSSFQDAPQAGLLDGYQIERIVLNPPREVLRARIAARFETMLESGAVKEVEALLAQKLDPSLPAMKAIGVREIAGWLEGSLSREEAAELAVNASRQYAKRQRTWFRNRMGDWTWIDPTAASPG